MLLILSSFVMFGYRANAFTILPVLLFYIFKLDIRKIKKIILTFALLFGFVLVPSFTYIFNIHTMSSMSAGFAWEIVSTIQDMDYKTKLKYINYLDSIGGEGSTLEAINTSTKITVNPLLTTKINRENLSKKGNSKIILKKYIDLLLEEPAVFLNNKYFFTKRTLGINSQIAFASYVYDAYGKMKEYNFNDSKARMKFIDSYSKLNEKISFYTLRPWLVFLITLIFVSIKWWKKDKNKNLYLLLFMISIFYYGAYIINTQAFEIRYFYPSLYICIIIDTIFTFDMLHLAKNKLCILIEKCCVLDMR